MILCWVGLHDWENIKTQQTSDIAFEVDSDRNKCGNTERDDYEEIYNISREIRRAIPSLSPEPGYLYHKWNTHKVCLRCGKNINEIETTRNVLVNRRNDKSIRQEKVQALKLKG